MIRYVIVILFATVILQSSRTNCQEEQLLNAVKGLLQGDELQKLQSMFSIQLVLYILNCFHLFEMDHLTAL